MHSESAVDVACVIHGDLYPWVYVENLYAMVSRNLNKRVHFHVFTEADRSVPGHMIRHDLAPWPGVSGRKKAWWYKMQMFDTKHGIDQILYFDLDVVIKNNIDWITGLNRRYFWTLRDFRYLWRPNWRGANTSVMWWNARKFHDVWQDFNRHDISEVMRRWNGDQDYITDTVDQNDIRFMNSDRIRSWRWQVIDGGMDMRTRTYRNPGAGAAVDPNTDIIIFHGNPKPPDLLDHGIVKENWCASDK
jgi:hypothetical protein